MALNLFETPKLTKPVQVYDPSKSVQENMNGQGQPSAQNIISAYQTPQAQLQLQQGQQQTAPVKTTPVVDPNSATSGMDAVIANMYTSPEQEEKMRKASVANQRILAIGDALRHIGNIYNTVNYAPSQQFNKPWEEEQTRYEKGKAVRDAANAHYLSYQQQKAAQDRAMAKMEMDFKFKQADDARKERLNDARVSRYNAQNSKDAANQAYWETRARLLEEGWPLEKAIKEARKAQIDAQTRLTTVKANQGGFAPSRSGGGRGGSNMPDYDVVTTYERDEEGHVKSSKKTRTVKHADGTTSTNTKTTQPKQTQKKALPGQEPAQPKRPAKKRLPGT